MVKIYRTQGLDVNSYNITMEKSKRIGKPYSMQPGRQHGEGAGHISNMPDEKGPTVEEMYSAAISRGLNPQPDAGIDDVYNRAVDRGLTAMVNPAEMQKLRQEISDDNLISSIKNSGIDYDAKIRNSRETGAADIFGMYIQEGMSVKEAATSTLDIMTNGMSAAAEGDTAVNKLIEKLKKHFLGE